MQPDRQSERPWAVTLEEVHQLDYIGEEAPHPYDKGEPEAEADRNAREAPTSGQLEAESAGDLELLDEEPVQ